MAAAVQPMAKSPPASSSKRGATQTLVSFILIIATFVFEPIITRGVGISKAPKSSRFSSFLQSSNKFNMKWYQRLLTFSGWKSNLSIFSEQWKSRLAALYAPLSKAWTSLGIFRYVAAAGILFLLGYSLYQFFSPKSASKQSHPVSGTRFDVDAAYSSPEQASTSIIQDIRGAGLKVVRGDIKTLLEVAFSAGKPVDDKKMAMEKVVAIAASLPPNSKARKILTNFLTEGLWKSLQHPPLSYQGEKFEYRMPDGSFNNVLFPDLGKAGTPYARTARRLRKLDGVRPDPGLLFDTLMGRAPGKFKENPAGLSSVLFYHASIIIHDIFRTNRLDPNISDTSSYLDLAPLYGSSLEDQLKIRTMERGLLKPDTFHEKRLLGQPPGVNIMLVMYNRFHNYVADMLLKINEGGRFTLPPTRNEKERKKALAKQDNDLFQTARLIVGGLYINISLHDYLRGLTNTHHTSSSWTIDPRVEIKKANGEEVSRGVGNQVSAEFNLLYRFHSIISQRDEKWLNNFLASLFPGTKKKLEDLTPQELLQGLLRWEQNIHPDPSKRVFDGLKRGPDGKFKDEDLVRIMTDSMEAPAGLFGPRMVPKALRVVETLGILQARKWRMASLNEFRSFFGLKRHETMEDINSDPEIANLLRHLYDSPDMVELYPGLFIEETKPQMSPGNGGCLGYTAGRAVFSDAITLVRSDRFYTIDYTPATLTNWGMQEVQQDYNVMGGSMFYKLFQRALPGWYPYNSLHIMQPMYTWKKNKEIAEELGTIDQFSLEKPKPPPTPVVLTKHSTICKVMKDQTSFRVPWVRALNDLFPGKKDYSSYMLSGDSASNAAQRALLGGIVYGPTDFTKLLIDTVKKTASAALKSQTFDLPGAASQINILKDIAIPVNTIIMADLFSMDLHSPENPGGTLSVPEVYKHLINVRTWGFNNNDPAMAFRRRLWAQESAKVMTETTTAVVSRIASEGKGLFKRLINFFRKSPAAYVKEGSLRWYGQHVVQELLAHGKTVEETADILWLTGVAGVGAPVGLFADVLQFFLQPQNASHWAKIQDIVSHAGPTCHQILRQYVLEAQRMTSRQRNVRVCAQDVSIDGQQFKKGDAVICLFGPACHDATCIPDPQTFKPGRPAEAYIQFGHGPHECLGKEITLTYCVGLLEVLAGLKNLRPAPGAMGELKSIQVGTEKCYLDDTWSWLTFDPTTWKLHFDGVGKGVCQHSTFAAAVAGQDVNSIYHALKLQDEEGPTSVDIAGSKQQSLIDHSADSIEEIVEKPNPAPAHSGPNGVIKTPQANSQGQATAPQASDQAHGSGVGNLPAISTPLVPSAAHGEGAAAKDTAGGPAASTQSQGQSAIVPSSSSDTPAAPATTQNPSPHTIPKTPDSHNANGQPSTVSSGTPTQQQGQPTQQQGQVSNSHSTTSSSSYTTHIQSSQNDGTSMQGMTTTTITHPIGTTVGVLSQGVASSQIHATGSASVETPGTHWLFGISSERDFDVQMPRYLAPPPHPDEASQPSSSTAATSQTTSTAASSPDQLKPSGEGLFASHHTNGSVKNGIDSTANGKVTHSNGSIFASPGKKETSELIQTGTFSTKEVYSYPQYKTDTSKGQNFAHSFARDPGSFISIRGLDLDRRNSHSISINSSDYTMDGFKVNVEAAKDTKLYQCNVDWMFAKENSIALGWWDTGADRSSLITTESISFKFDKPVEGIKGMLVVLNGFDAEGTSGGATSLDISVEATSWDTTGCTIRVTAGSGCKLHRAKGHWLAYTYSNAIATGEFTSAGKKHHEEQVSFSDDWQNLNAPPKIITGLNKVNFDISKANLRCLLESKDVTNKGFKWVWDVWSDSVPGVCEGVYVALDQRLLAPH